MRRIHRPAVLRARPIDPYFSKVGLLLHFDGSDGSPTFVDQIGHAVTAGGSAQISTAAPVFGSGSALLNGSTDYLSIADVADLEFGSLDHTIECWLTPTTTLNGSTAQKVIACKWGASTPNLAWLLGYDTGTLNYNISNNISSPAASGAITLTAGVPVHVAACRAGTTLYMLAGGALLGTASVGSLGISDTTQAINIGRKGNGAAYMDCRIDEFRITIGVARYTAAYAVPTGPFPDR